MNILMTLMTCFVEAYLYLMLMDTYFEKKEVLNSVIRPFVICIMAVCIFIGNMFFNFGIWNAVVIFSVIITSSLFYRCPFLLPPVIAALGILLSVITEIITMFGLSAIFGITTEQLMESDILRYLGTVISKIFGFAVFKIVCYGGKNKSKKTASYWILFFVVFASTTVAEFLFFNLSYHNPKQELSILTVICSVGLMLSNFFVIYLYENMAKQAEITGRQQVVEQQIKSQAKHLDEILFMQGELRKFRHDIKNHMAAIEEYFRRDDSKGGQAYIASMDEAISKTQRSVSTGNIALDAIINSKLLIAESKKIEFKTNIQIYENLGIEPIDVCVIFGNALDNAIEACEKLKDKKYICIQIIYDEDCVICKISNSCAENKSMSLKTTKQDRKNHGYGIENIKAALSKYKHVLNIEQKENEFVLSFIIFDV